MAMELVEDEMKAINETKIFKVFNLVCVDCVFCLKTHSLWRQKKKAFPSRGIMANKFSIMRESDRCVGKQTIPRRSSIRFDAAN